MKLQTLYFLKDSLDQTCFMLLLEDGNLLALHPSLQLPLTRFLLKVYGRYNYLLLNLIFLHYSSCCFAYLDILFAIIYGIVMFIV